MRKIIIISCVLVGWLVGGCGGDKNGNSVKVQPKEDLNKLGLAHFWKCEFDEAESYYKEADNIPMVEKVMKARNDLPNVFSKFNKLLDDFLEHNIDGITFVEKVKVFFKNEKIYIPHEHFLRNIYENAVFSETDMMMKITERLQNRQEGETIDVDAFREKETKKRGKRLDVLSLLIDASILGETQFYEKLDIMIDELNKKRAFN